MMHLAEFDTMIRHKMPLLIVVLNNEVARFAGTDKLDAHKMDPKKLSVITDARYGRRCASVLAGKARFVTKTKRSLQKAAQEWVANPCPMIIDARGSNGRS